MYDELDQLLKLTKCFEAESTKVVDEDDLDATIHTFDEAGNYTESLSTATVDDDYEDEDEGEDEDDTAKSKSKPKPKSKSNTKAKLDDDKDEDDADEDEETPEDDYVPVDDSEKPTGSSGNVIVKGKKDAKGKKRSPIFEPDGDIEKMFEDFGSSDIDECPVQDESLGIGGIGKQMKKEMSLTESIEYGMGREFARKYRFESENPLFVSNAPFKLGDVVCCDSNPMLYVVKNNDGSTITAAKPTCNQADFCHCKDGCWPEFTFSQDEIKPMANASMNDLGDIAAFNDRFRGFDGTIEDRSPMERAQEYARNQTVEDISQNLDEILGQYQCAAFGGDKDFTYTQCSPKVVFRRPDGSVTTEQQMGGYQIRWGD